MAREAGLTLELEAIVPMAPERVYSLLTDPAELPRWWGPHGFTTPQVDVDLRVGGSYRFRMQPPEGEAFHLRGEYTEITPGHLVSYTFVWEEPDPDDVETFVTLSLRAVDGGTEVRLVQRGFATADRVALHRGGWSDGLERLRALD